MLNRIKYTDSEMNELIKSIVILVDTREKQDHVTQYYDKHKVPYEKIALPCGDYSAKLPKNPDLGIYNDMIFYNDVILERKNSLEELSGCFTQTRVRFNDEFATSYAKRKHLLIENATYEDLVKGNYNTDYNKKSFLASLHSFNIKYDLQIMFIKDKSYSPIYILGVMQYYIRYLLK
jgi:ERCC4-type nuclease